MDEAPKILSGKNALVIGGGGGGIGRAITRGLAAAGSAVAVADIDRDRADEAAAEVAAAGAKSVSLTGDVRSREHVEGFVTRAAQELGGARRSRNRGRWATGVCPGGTAAREDR
jgi:3-oxoacyl-[acyl-carrier protein] reductase